MLSSTEVLTAMLKNPTDIDHVRSLVSPDVTYILLNYHNPDLKRIMPWAGTSRGPKGIVDTFAKVPILGILSFEPEAVFGSNGFAAIFGRIAYRSRVLSKAVTTPFAVFAKVDQGRCTCLQFMEDTFATGASFRSRGSWTFRSDPNGETVVI